jgi:hypothetical protein
VAPRIARPAPPAGKVACSYGRGACEVRKARLLGGKSFGGGGAVWEVGFGPGGPHFELFSLIIL